MNMHATAHARPQKPSIPPFTGLPPLPAIEALQQHRQWVAWDYVWKDDKAKWDKPPLNPRTGGFASSSSSETWGSYEEAARRARAHGLAGVGFVLSPADDFTGVDLDKCRNAETGTLKPWAAEIVGLAKPMRRSRPP